MDWYWSWILSAVGLLGFFLAGSKVWWAWYVNIFNQVIWTVYAIVTEQWGFLVGTAFYFVVFIRNAVKWTREHWEREARSVERVGDVIPKQTESLLPDLFWVHHTARKYGTWGYTEDGFKYIDLKGNWYWYETLVGATNAVFNREKIEALGYATGKYYVKYDDGQGPLLLSKEKLIGPGV